ncbi:MAG TPA: MarR family transcriptional regulator [Acidimicrobiales bacterium]|nr:MarR family transcriptional regulator [Acidimicrobiales bacterium]
MTTKALLLPGRVAARLARQVDVGLAQVDLSLPQYRILLFLAEGAVAASALADNLAVSRPSVTAVVDGLVSRGLVERRHDEGDRRRVGHTLTAEGRRILDQADAAVDARLAEIARFLTDEQEAATAFEGLARWRSALDAFRASRKSENR